MAVPTGTGTTYNQIGIREDLAEAVYNTDPSEAPFLSMSEQVEVENTLFEWQTQDLNAVDKSGALDGDDAPQDSYNPTTLLNNRTHIRTRDARVSGTARSVTVAGRGDDLDAQMLDRGLEIRRDMESILLDNNAKVVGNASTARETAGVEAWLTSNVSRGTGGSSATGDGTDAATDGTQRAYTEGLLKTVLASCWDNGGNPDCIMVGSFNKQAQSAFTGRATAIEGRAEVDVLNASYAIYDGDFGTQKVIPNRFSRARSALVLDMSMWAVGFLPGRNMTDFPIAKTGDSDARQVLAEFGLIAKNEKASGIVADLTTS